MPDLTLAAALLAGLLSFLSPCVLPVVPAYLGQLGAVSVGGSASNVGGSASNGGDSAGSAPFAAAMAPSRSAVVAGDIAAARVVGSRVAASRWLVMRHAIAFVVGFGGVFTILGVSATYAGGVLAPDLPLLRQAGGIVLIVLGLHLAGLLPIGFLARTWRPLQSAGPTPLDGARRSPFGALGLGAIFALGWTPCIGPTLGAILGLAALGPSAQAGLLFVAYSTGLGIPFILLALAFDQSAGLVRTLRRHARAIELAGGGLVALIGLSLVFDWLGWFSAQFSYLTLRI